jgi:hypothetical protein
MTEEGNKFGVSQEESEGFRKPKSENSSLYELGFKMYAQPEADKKPEATWSMVQFRQWLEEGRYIEDSIVNDSDWL